MLKETPNVMKASAATLADETRLSSEQEAIGERESISAKSIENPIHHNGSEESSNEESQETLDTGNRESKAVFWLRLVLLGILCAFTVGVAVGVYYYTREAEQSDFEERYEEAAAKVLEAIGSKLHLSLAAIDSFVIDTVAFAQSDSYRSFVNLLIFRCGRRNFLLLHMHLLSTSTPMYQKTSCERIGRNTLSPTMHG